MSQSEASLRRSLCVCVCVCYCSSTSPRLSMISNETQTQMLILAQPPVAPRVAANCGHSLLPRRRLSTPRILWHPQTVPTSCFIHSNSNACGDTPASHSGRRNNPVSGMQHLMRTITAASHLPAVSHLLNHTSASQHGALAEWRLTHPHGEPTGTFLVEKKKKKEEKTHQYDVWNYPSGSLQQVGDAARCREREWEGLLLLCVCVCMCVDKRFCESLNQWIHVTPKRRESQSGVKEDGRIKDAGFMATDTIGNILYISKKVQ